MRPVTSTVGPQLVGERARIAVDLAEQRRAHAHIHALGSAHLRLLDEHDSNNSRQREAKAKQAGRQTAALHPQPTAGNTRVELDLEHTAATDPVDNSPSLDAHHVSHRPRSSGELEGAQRTARPIRMLEVTDRERYVLAELSERDPPPPQQREQRAKRPCPKARRAVRPRTDAHEAVGDRPEVPAQRRVERDEIGAEHSFVDGPLLCLTGPLSGVTEHVQNCSTVLAWMGKSARSR
jgi:hypothetical protein